MKSQKLVITLNAMTKSERRRLGQFLQSPYFNQRQDVAQLYAFLQEPTGGISTEMIIRQLWPDHPNAPQQLRLLMSYLQKLVEQFLALEQWQGTPGAVESELVKVYRQRGLERHFQDSFKLANDILNNQPLRNTDYFGWQGALLWEEARFNTLRQPENSGRLSQLSDNADLFWLSQKLRYGCLHMAFQARFSTAQGLSLRQEIDHILSLRDFLQTPAIATWFYCLRMLENPENLDFFQHFKTLLLQHGQIFNVDEVRDLFLFAINFCIRQVNEGKTGFFHDILDFYKDGLSKGHLFENGVLSHFTYFNIVAAALHTSDFAWAETFIHEQRNALERSYRDSAFSFNLARLEFARKRFDAALSQLQHSNYHDPLLSMAAKTIALKIYYESDEFEVLHAHLEALIKYIRRKPGLGYHRNNYLNLARYTQKLIGLNWNDKTELLQLRQKIEAEPVLTEREWLLEQLGKKR